MMKTIAAAAVLLLAACGGTDGTDSGPDTDTGRVEIGPGVWEQDGQICATYLPTPLSNPSTEVETCVPSDWPSVGICWRIDDELDCVRADGTNQATACKFIRDDDFTGASAGTMTLGCSPAGDCIPDGVDNPECCVGSALDCE